MLTEDDCYIPRYQRNVPELTKKARCTSDIIRNGVDRGDENLWIGKSGDIIEYEFDKNTKITHRNSRSNDNSIVAPA